MQIFLDHALECLVLVSKPEHAQRIGKRVARDGCKVLVAPHQRAQPGVFELLDPPDLRDDLAIPRKCVLGDLRDRLDVVERSVGIEYNGFEAQWTCPPGSLRSTDYTRRRGIDPRRKRDLGLWFLESDHDLAEV